MKKGIWILIAVFLLVIVGIIFFILNMNDSNQFEGNQNSDDIILHEWTFSEKYLNLLIENKALETLIINDISSSELSGASDCTLERGTGELVPNLKKVARLQCNGWENNTPFSIKINVVYVKNGETKDISFSISDTVKIM